TVGGMTVTRLQKVFAPVKRALPRFIWAPVRAVATGVITPIRFSALSGHWRSSLRMSASSANGEPIPWYTYPAIDFLAQRHFQDRHVLEFGGGQSTRWWSNRARSVFTIEEDPAWAARIREQAAGNVTVQHVTVGETEPTVREIKRVLAAQPIERFDVIV